LEAYFKEHPPASLPQAAAMIEQLTGIKRSAKQVGVFLKTLGLKRLKTYAVPAKIDSQVQETVKKTNWSHAENKPKREHAPSFLSIVPILSYEPILAFSGASSVWWSGLPVDGNGSMCWGHSTPSSINSSR